MPQALENLLKDVIGLDPATLGAGAIERAVKDRQSACKAPDARAYWDIVRSSPRELQELIEALVVPETWFFRDREAFAALGRVAVPAWLKTHPEGTMRLLSLPCSTGEEPYSIAMALLDAGLPGPRFHVDAVDISVRALALARRAVYGRNSFRGAELDFRDRHFEATAHGHRPREAVRERVTFHHGNLFDELQLSGKGPYDVAFCRNVLIYFDRPTQDRAIGVLTRLLTPDAYLFVGPSETSLAMSHGFVSAGIPLAFAFRLPAARSLAVPPVAAPPTALRRTSAPRVSSPRVVRAAPATPASPTPASALSRARPTHSLEEAARMADVGRLDEAARACETVLRACPANAQAHYLLGLVRDAAGDTSAAATHYRKALYLEPQHEESLAHLALLLERQGDARAASLLRKRARRASPTQRG